MVSTKLFHHHSKDVPKFAVQCQCAMVATTTHRIFIYKTMHLVPKHYATIPINVVCVSVSHLLLPLSFLPAQELLQNSNPFLQSLHFLLQAGLHLRAVFAELAVEVFPVWGSGHRSAEDGLDHKRVVRLEGVSVGLAERL